MESLNKDLPEELEYLNNTIDFLKKAIEEGEDSLSYQKHKVISSRRDMWNESAHFSNDFEKMIEVNQHLIEVTNQTAEYVNKAVLVSKYKKAMKSPYFGRFDFIEEGSTYKEKIYIGLHNIMDPQSLDILVYDWRAPISGIFYQYEIGRAKYNAPEGEYQGDVSLKRQYKIEDSKLQYFFDSSVTIKDELLQETLCKNASAKMKNIVETIQKEQDMIIRDIHNELLIVQGVAGSGKTSVALHRIAYLLYHGAGSSLRPNNIVIVSPNDIFTNYISSVLPELGEENVQEATFEGMLQNNFKNRFSFENRNTQLEVLIKSTNPDEREFRMQSIEFKGSVSFVKLLDRFIKYYERRLIPFEDVCFRGKIIEKRDELKNWILNDKIGIPLGKRLEKVKDRILVKISPLRRERIPAIERIVQKSEGHDFEIKSFSRLLSIKEANVFMEQIKKFTTVDYFEVYKRFLSDIRLIYKLSAGIILPDNIEAIILKTRENLEKGVIPYEDASALLYIKLRLEGANSFNDIRQVVIDEAQDYYPVQYEVFKLLFKDAKFTVLGDINQKIENTGDKSLYDTIEKVLDKRRSVKVFLNKGYRSSYEISMFNHRLLGTDIDFVPFERHESEPVVIREDTLESLDKRICHDVHELLGEGYESIGIICKTQEEAEAAYERLKGSLQVRLLSPLERESQRGVNVMSSYMSKGLEFDGVLVYGASKENYSNGLDKKLLYIACTRALHRLKIYFMGEKTPLIPG